jgi:hypothetical protein
MTRNGVDHNSNVEAPSWRCKRLKAASTESAGPLAGIMIKAKDWP